MPAKRIIWRLFALMAAISLLSPAVACKKDADTTTEKDPWEKTCPGDPSCEIVVAACGSDNTYIIGGDVTTEYAVSPFDSAYTGQVADTGQTTATTAITFDATTTYLFWNIGPKLFMGRNTAEIVTGSVVISQPRSSITSIAAMKDGEDILLIVGTTHGYAYVRATVSTGSLQTIFSHRFPLTVGNTDQIGVNSVFIDEGKDGKANVYLTTTARHILKISIDAVKAGSLGCLDMAVDLSGEEDPYMPVKAVVVRDPAEDSERAFLVYLAQKSTLMNVPAPLSKTEVLTDMLWSMIDSAAEPFAIVRAIDLRNSETADVVQDSTDALSKYNKWVPQDIAVSKAGILLVGALAYEDQVFKTFLTTNCSTYSDTAGKISCLLVPGILTASGSTGSVPPKIMDDIPAKSTFHLGIYKYDIRNLAEEEGKPKEVTRAFDKADYINAAPNLTQGNPKYDSFVPRMFLKLFVFSPTTGETKILVRGTDFIRAFDTGGFLLAGTVEASTVAVGYPSSIAGYYSGTGVNTSMIGTVRAFDGRWVSLLGNGVTEFYPTTSADKSIKAIAIGNDAPKPEELASDGKTLFYITRTVADAGKIYSIDTTKLDSKPLYKLNGTSISTNVATGAGGNFYCFDANDPNLYVKNTATAIDIGCGSNTFNHLYIPFTYEVLADMKSVGVPKVADMKIIGDALVILFRAYDVANRLNYYRIVVAEISTGGDTVTHKGITSWTNKISDPAQLNPDTIAHFLDVKSEATKVTGKMITSGGLYSFDITKGTQAAPTKDNALPSVFTTGTSDIATAAFDAGSKTLVDFLKTGRKVEVRSSDTPAVQSKSFDDASSELPVLDAFSEINNGLLYLNVESSWNPSTLVIYTLADSTLKFKISGSFIRDMFNLGNDQLLMSGVGGGLEIFTVPE